MIVSTGLHSRIWRCTLLYGYAAVRYVLGWVFELPVGCNGTDHIKDLS